MVEWEASIVLWYINGMHDGSHDLEHVWRRYQADGVIATTDIS